ncbi:hypothetical protein BDV97DRAFT_356543 [Delphinella strobiligena]|nr:hypothetical protein BDV97DRAFT_356543 [Delphinella strobiligena]
MEVASENVAIGGTLAEDNALDNDISSSATEGLESDASQPEGSTGSYEDVDDQTLLDYARSHGLCTDYTSENPLALDFLRHVQSGHDPEDADLVQDQLPQDFTIDEKFSLDPSSALFLRCILSTCDNDSPQDLTKERARKFRADSPLLLTDTKLDLRLFTQNPDIGNGLKASHLPYLIGGDGPNEELEWLDIELLAMKDMQTSSERLQLTQDDTYFLQTACQNIYSDDEDYPVILQELDFSRKVPLQHETLPLLAPSSPFLPDNPASSAGRLEVVSSPFDPYDDELDGLEELFLKDDAAQRSGGSMDPHDSVMNPDRNGGMLAPPQFITTKGSSSPVKRQRCEDFKEELPLTPTTSSSSPLKKLRTVTFSEALVTTIPNYAEAFPSHDYENFGEDVDMLFDSMLRPAAEAAVFEIETEQLSEADSRMRVEVPRIDRTMPLLPWDRFRPSHGEQKLPPESGIKREKELLSVLKATLLREEKLWPGGSSIDHDVGGWVPFPSHLGIVANEEKLDEGSHERYLAKLSFKETEIQAWKPKGLRILDERDKNNDKLEKATHTTYEDIRPTLEDLQILIARRQQDISPARGLGGIDRASAIMIAPSRDQYADHTSPCQENEAPLILGTGFSATTSLGRFMQAQTGMAPKIELHSKAGISNTDLKPGGTCAPSTHEQAKAQKAPRIQPPTPVPTVDLPSPAQQVRQFILSSSLLARRRLLRQIECLYPAAQFIERDLDGALSNGDTENQGEADLILSPSAGLLLSSLQQIKQKALPGHIQNGGIRERIATLADRYEQLVVLVSEGRLTSLEGSENADRNLDDRDCNALSSLITFATGLGSDVRVLYVTGGEETLASWSVSCMRRYGIDDSGTKLVPDETLWEMFLRRAGMNAFAAQAVLIALREPSSDSDNVLDKIENGGHGLPAFVHMRPEERIRRFTAMLGGSRLLTRVSRVIDGGW